MKKVETTSISTKELEKIQKQQETLSDTIKAIGQLESQKHALLHQQAGLSQEIEEFKQELETKYGRIRINIEDGSYTEIPEEENKE
tara:strand:- start:4449 stop:4706 length:258 start_codon:yes stop_codon:yes gene_type:complete